MEDTKFYELFKPNKVKYKTPGRDWDEDGLASWYVEEVKAPIDGELFIKLFALLNYWQCGEVALLKGIYEQELINQLKLALIKAYERINVDLGIEDASDFRAKVKEIIDEYHEQWGEE